MGFTTTNILAAATVVLAFGSIWQTCTSRDTEERQLRAYVCVGIDSSVITSTRVVGDSVVDTYYRTLTIKNTGQTPAYNLTSRYRTELAQWFSGDQLSPIPANNATASKATLNPGAGVNIPNSKLWTGIEFNPTAANLINDSMVGIFTWGQITYQDAFGDWHFTNFKYAFARSPSEPAISYTNVWRSGNDAN